MKYSRSDIMLLIDLAFKGAQADPELKKELNCSDSRLTRYKEILMNSEVLAALEILFNAVYPQAYVEEHPMLHATSKYPLEILGLSARPFLALSKRAGLRSVSDLLRLTDSEITNIRGIGPESMAEIVEKRAKFIDDYNRDLIK